MTSFIRDRYSSYSINLVLEQPQGDPGDIRIQNPGYCIRCRGDFGICQT